MGTVTDTDLSRPKFLRFFPTFWAHHLIPRFLSSAKTYYQVDRLEDELASEQEKLKAITEELEQTFAEMSGY